MAVTRYILAIASLACLTQAAGLSTESIHKPNYALYHSKSKLFARVSSIASASPSMSEHLEFFTSPAVTANMSVVTVDFASADTSLTAPKVPVLDKLRLLVDFGEHGRELISSEMGLRLLQLLAMPGQLREQLEADLGASEAATIMLLLQCCVTLQVVPMENTSGREKVEAGELCERKNGAGVDPNRNWDIDFGVKEKDYRPSEENPGPHAFSEPETLLMRQIAEKFQPHVWINVHSGMQGIFMPYDHLPNVADGPHDHATLAMLHDLNKQCCGSECTVGSGGSSVGYLAHGTATDYMYSVLKVPVAMTWEIYGDEAAPFKDCFRMFNPLTGAEYDRVLRRWTNAVFYTVLLMRDHPAVQSLGLQRRMAEAAARVTAKQAPAPPWTNIDWTHGGAGTEGSGGGTVIKRVGGRNEAVRQQETHPERVVLLYAVGAIVAWCILRLFITGARKRKPLVETV